MLNRSPFKWIYIGIENRDDLLVSDKEDRVNCTFVSINLTTTREVSQTNMEVNHVHSR